MLRTEERLSFVQVRAAKKESGDLHFSLRQSNEPFWHIVIRFCNTNKNLIRIFVEAEGIRILYPYYDFKGARDTDRLSTLSNY